MRTGLALIISLTFSACSPGDAPAAAAAERFPSEHGELEVTTVAEGLEHPWGLAFLPDGRRLVTERTGRMRLIDADGVVSKPLAGLPEVYARGQGGLLDVAVDPDFATTPLGLLQLQRTR